MVNAECTKNSFIQRFDLVEQRSGRDALEVFEEAINNIMPVLEVKARRGWFKLPSTS